MAGIVKRKPTPAEYIEPGSMLHTHVHPETDSYISAVTRPTGRRSASITDLYVPEEHRQKGIGKMLLNSMMQQFPSLQGQVSSKVAAKNAYAAGRRMAGNENASLDDVYKKIDEDSSVNMWTPKAEGGEVDEPGITAYHGSPHDFEQFDMSKIGTGEGAQAYGHGLYFAEAEPVAMEYRDKLTGVDLSPFENIGLAPHHVKAAESYVKTSDPTQTEVAAKDFANWVGVRHTPELTEAFKSAKKQGHMYGVHINAHPDHFLDWDKPISEQSEHVQKAIKHIAGQLDIDPFEHLALAAAVGRHPRSQTYSPRGEDLHTDIDEILGGKEHASKALHAAGIKGIRYLDAGSRPDGAYALHISHKGIPYTDPIPMKTFQQAQNHAKEYAAKGYDTEIKENGSRNYVVFDDKLVNVKRKYEKGGIVQGEAPIHALHLTSKFGNSLPSAVNQAKAATRRRP